MEARSFVALEHKMVTAAGMRYLIHDSALVPPVRLALGSSEELEVASRKRGYTLFGGRVAYESSAAVLERGGEVRTTRSSGTFGPEEFGRPKGEGGSAFPERPRR